MSGYLLIDGTISESQDTINQSAISGTTTFSGSVIANSFVKTGGTNLQFLMADGSVTTSSGSGGNSSNIYLYDNNQTTTPVPANGQIRYNNAAQASATIIYVSHMTRDGVDIDEFLALISDLSIIYIQDQNSSLNFIKYTVTAAPTIIVNSYISIPVSVSSSAGTGATSFGAGHDIFMSIFSNTTLIDNRITTLELKTQNQGAIASTTNFTGKVNATTKLQANTFIISNTATDTIAITKSEMNSLTGSGNVLIGPLAGSSMTTGASNTCIGYNSGRFIVSTGHNTGCGQDSLRNCVSSFNTAVGSSSLFSINTAGAEYNTAVGWDASQLLLSGTETTAVGGHALQNNLNSNNTALGYNAGSVMTNQYTNVTCLGHSSQPDSSNQVRLGNTLVTEVKSSGVFNSGIGFKTPTGSVTDLLRANGTISTITNNKGEFQHMMCYNPTTNNISYKINTDGWRFQSFGYNPQSNGAIAVDTSTAALVHQGNTITGLNISFTNIKTSKIRAQSNITTPVDGSVSGWMGAAFMTYLQIKGGFYVKISFGLEASTATSVGSRTMVGLYQSVTAPTLNNATTIDSITTGSIGIIQEKGENTFSFNTRGPSGSTKIATSIPCDTPNSNWYILEIMNEPFSSDATIVLTCQNNTTQTIQRESTTFTCGTSTTMPLGISYPQLQQSVANLTPAVGNALISLGNLQLKLYA